MQTSPKALPPPEAVRRALQRNINMTLLSQQHASHASHWPSHEAIKCITLIESEPKESLP